MAKFLIHLWLVEGTGLVEDALDSTHLASFGADFTPWRGNHWWLDLICPESTIRMVEIVDVIGRPAPFKPEDPYIMEYSVLAKAKEPVLEPRFAKSKTDG